MTTDTIHTCSYYCERPGCIRAQRDYLAARLAVAQQPAAPNEEAAAFDANFLRHIASVCRAAYDLCQPKPQRTPEDVREYNGGLCLSELTSIADEIERRLAAVDGAKETDLWRCTVCGRVGTVGRCCGEETREPLAPPSAPVGVDWPTIVEGLRLADHFFDGDDRYWQPASKVRAAYRAALAAQQQGGAA